MDKPKLNHKTSWLLKAALKHLKQSIEFVKEANSFEETSVATYSLHGLFREARDLEIHYLELPRG